MDLQKMKQKTKLGNSGFSLVELIIVIAIMAILIAVLAPMFIRYVERSRQSNDISTVGSMMRALEAAAADPRIDPGTTYQLVWTGSGGTYTVTRDGTDVPALTNEVAATVGSSGQVNADSAAVNAGGTVTLTFNLQSNTKTYATTVANSDFSSSISALNN